MQAANIGGIENLYGNTERSKMTSGTVLAIFAGVIVGTFAALMVWDYRLYTDNTEGNSITQSLIDFSKRFPAIAWAIGFLMGAFVGHIWL